MIYHGGTVTGGRGDAQAMSTDNAVSVKVARPPQAAQVHTTPVRWSVFLAAVVGVSFLLAVLPGRTQIPPLVESDYCYQLIAADRLLEGRGLTAPPPVAPFQPWTWQADWVFLTQWPIGYSLLVAAVAKVFDLRTIEACQWISVVACAAALVGWFVWIKRNVPAGVTGWLLAAVAAGCAVPVASLTNPSTDALLVALVPIVLLCATQAIRQVQEHRILHGTQHGRECAQHGPQRAARQRAMLWFASAGLMAGGLFWLRYASVFVPLAIGLYLLAERYRREAPSVRQIGVFTVCTAFPVGALLIVNGVFGAGGSAQARLNLGTTLGFDLTLRDVAAAWRGFTDFGFYDYHWFSHWLFALWPISVVAVAVCIRPVRTALRSFVGVPGVGLSVCVVVGLLAMLISATAVLGDKYYYVGLDRYYLPVKPLYFLLFVAPLMLIPRRFVRLSTCVVLVVACSWLVQQDWARTYNRWLSADREVTQYGRWGRAFDPNPAALYDWLAKQDAPNLIVISNYHEYITLETKIPALPIPDDESTLRDWIDRICVSRGVSDPRVLFVLDPDNRWRSYWIKDPAAIIQTFSLRHRVDTPTGISTFVFDRAGIESARVVSPGATFTRS